VSVPHERRVRGASPDGEGWGWELHCPLRTGDRELGRGDARVAGATRAHQRVQRAWGLGYIRLSLFSTAQPLYSSFPIMFSSCFSKVTIGYHPSLGLGGGDHFHAPLYISFVILHAKQTADRVKMTSPPSSSAPVVRSVRSSGQLTCAHDPGPPRLLAGAQ
jgi:hypothetical protein